MISLSRQYPGGPASSGGTSVLTSIQLVRSILVASNGQIVTQEGVMHQSSITSSSLIWSGKVRVRRSRKQWEAL